MLISSAVLRWVSNEKGHGIFAKEFIPKGTITFVNDALDIYLDPNDPKFQKEPYLSLLDRYAYNAPDGRLVLCWDFGKYMNHCCWPNTLSTGYGFDIAIKDIAIGEEITTDYGTISTGHEMVFQCEKANCRKGITNESFDQCAKLWDEQILEALKLSDKVTQPLWNLLEKDVISDLNRFFQGETSSYRSVYQQKPR